MENNRKNKIKFFAQYWGSYGFEKFHIDREEGRIVPINEYYIGTLEYLPLKLLANITQEDAVILGKLYLENTEVDYHLVEDVIFEGVELNDNFLRFRVKFKGFEDELTHLRLIDMRSKYVDKLRELGYAYPWNSLSVEQQIEYNWIKIKEDE